MGGGLGGGKHYVFHSHGLITGLNGCEFKTSEKV